MSGRKVRIRAEGVHPVDGVLACGATGLAIVVVTQGDPVALAFFGGIVWLPMALAALLLKSSTAVLDDDGVTVHRVPRGHRRVGWAEVEGVRWERELPPLGEDVPSAEPTALELLTTSGRVLPLLCLSWREVRDRRVRAMAHLLWALHERDVRMEGRPLTERPEVRAIWAAVGRDPGTGRYPV